MSVKGTRIAPTLRTITLPSLLLCFGFALAFGQVAARVQEDFFQAMLAGDTNSALQLLAANTNLAHAASYQTKYPLLVAASKGHVSIVDELLKLGADANAEGDTWDTGNKHLTALEVGVWYNHPGVVKRLLEAGADPNHLSPWDGSALHLAFSFSREEMAGWLLDRGANPFLEGGNPYQKTTPFALAITRGNGKLVPRMLNESRVPPVKPRPGAQLLAEDILPPLNPRVAKLLATRGAALLATAAQRGELEAVEALLRAGVSPKNQPADGFSLMQGFARAQANAAQQKDFSVERWAKIRALLAKHGAVCDALAATALGDMKTAHQRVSGDKNVIRTVDYAGDTPMHWAVLTEQLPFTSFWLEAGVSAAATNFAGQTALHLAATRGLAEHVKLLLAAHAPTEARDTNGWTPLDAAIQAQQPVTIRLLLGTNTPVTVAVRGLSTPIHKAAASGNIVVLAALLNASNLEARDELGFTPFQLAVVNGQLGAATLLLDRGADVKATDPDGNTTLHLILLRRPGGIASEPPASWLARKKSELRNEPYLRYLTTPNEQNIEWPVPHTAAFLLAAGADPAAVNKTGKTAAQIATEEATRLFDDERAAFLKLIGTTGGSLDARDANGDTPLHVAARGFFGDQVVDLIAGGANLEATNRLGRTPLHAVLEKLSGWGEHAPFQEILRANPNVNAQDNEGLTPLHVVALSDSSFREQSTPALLATGANPNLRDKHERTPAHLFLSGEWPWPDAGECVEMLAKAGANLSAKDDQGRVPLHNLAALGGNHSPMFFIRGISNTFATAKVDLDVRDHQGDTPLHLAARAGNTDVFEWLSKLGARLDVTNGAGETPLRISTRTTDRFSRVQFNSTTDIFAVVQRGDIEALRRLLSAEPSLANATSQYGETPLRTAARLGHTNAVALLVEKGAQWDAISAATLGRTAELETILARQLQAGTNKSRGKTLLHLAAESGVVSTAEAVLAAGADLNARDAAGFTPLGCAHLQGRKQMAGLLKTRGAVENIFDAVLLDDLETASALLARDKTVGRDTNTFGFTPAHLAAALGRDRVLTALLEQKVSPNVASSRGETPLHLAAVCNRSSAAALLLRRKAGVEPFDRDGFTPLHLAALYGSADVAALLLKHGAKADTRTRSRPSDAHPPMSLGGHAGNTALHLAVLSCQTNIIQSLLKARASVSATNAVGLSPLDYVPPSGFIGGNYGIVSLRKTGLALRSALQQCGVADLTNRLSPLVPAPRQQTVAAILEAAGAKRGRPPGVGWTP